MKSIDNATIKDLARKLQIRPSSILGQNFLVDEDVLKKIIKTADIKKGDKILEIGPGLGILTRALLQAGASVLAIERDKKLVKYLQDHFSDYPDLRILEKDILKISNKEIFNLLGGKFRVVSNIPYQITGKIIKKFVSSELPKPESAILLVQKEVAQRVCAQKGKMSMLALSVQAYAKPEISIDVPKTAFWPVPKVDSSLLRINGIKERIEPNIDEKRFWQIARIGFSSPRKQLKNNLSCGLRIDQAEVSRALSECRISDMARAQELGVEDWISFVI